MAHREEQLEAIKIYRDAARHYFNTRTNVTYFNIVGFGSITVLLARNLVDASGNCYFSIIESHFWLFLGGLLLIVALSAWATSLCNLLSNSFFSYMHIVRAIETDMGIPYPPPQSWAVTIEFLSPEARRDIYGLRLQGNVWNIANGFLGLSGTYAMIMISEIAHVGLVFYGACLAYVALIGLIMFRSVSRKARATLFSSLAIAVSAAFAAASPAQREIISHLDPTGVSVWQDSNSKICESPAKSGTPLPPTN